MSANLQVLMLHHVTEYLQYIDLLHQLLALILASIAQTEVHKEGTGVLHRVITQVVLARLEDVDNPSNDAAFNHGYLSCFAEAKLL